MKNAKRITGFKTIDAAKKLTKEELADQIANEMERAYNAAVNVGALKQSDWWQDRKAQVVALRA
jgi:hypothetical protein